MLVVQCCSYIVKFPNIASISGYGYIVQGNMYLGQPDCMDGKYTCMRTYMTVLNWEARMLDLI